MKKGRTFYNTLSKLLMIQALNWSCHTWNPVSQVSLSLSIQNPSPTVFEVSKIKFEFCRRFKLVFLSHGCNNTITTIFHLHYPWKHESFFNHLIDIIGINYYRKIPKISTGAYIFQRPFLRGLFLEGLIFGGAYLRREICVSKSIGLPL